MKMQALTTAMSPTPCVSPFYSQTEMQVVTLQGHATKDPSTIVIPHEIHDHRAIK